MEVQPDGVYWDGDAAEIMHKPASLLNTKKNGMVVLLTPTYRQIVNVAAKKSRWQSYWQQHNNKLSLFYWCLNF